MRSRAPTLNQVAALAGVSHQTVSRVLNRHANVSANTRARVLAAIHQLDYQPNTAARTLVTDRSQTIGLITFDGTLAGPSSIVWAIQQAARQAGYFVSIANVPPSDASSIQDAVTRLRQQRVDGILSFTPTTTARTALRDVPTAIPLVAIGATTPSRAIGPPTVGIDNRAGAALATRHLLALGHHTVHHVAGPPDCPEASERTTGWRHALRAAGRPVPQARTGDWSAASGCRAGELLIADRSVTAIFCGNDQMAIGVLHALHASGRSVPGNVSVVGFDDLPETAFLLPPLTTIRHDFAEVGRRSIHLLLRQITDDVRNLTIPLAISPRLVVRSSTAPPPVSSSNV